MAVTQADFLKELERRGYGEITSRWLVSARGKGLLPKLTRHGRGHGQGIGARYLISNPEIVIEQAITVYELLRLHNRTETALLSAWFAGFEIPIKLVRKNWLRRINKHYAQVNRQTIKSGTLEDALSKISDSAARELAAKYNLDCAATSAVILEILNSIYDSEYEFEEEVNWRFFFEIISALGKFEKGESIDFLPEGKLLEMMDLFRHVASLKSQRALISSATKRELILAQQLWRRIGKIIQQIAIGISPQFFSGPGIPSSRRAAIAFGGMGIILLLNFTKFDSNSSVLRTIDLWDKLTESADFPIILKVLANSNGVSDNADHQSSDFWEAARAIWATFDFGKFARKIAIYSQEIDQGRE